ncbi:helix-turn-helix domain-containing protein [Planctomycetota bacterium]
MQPEAIQPKPVETSQESLTTDEQVLTVSEVSSQLKVSEEQVRTLIRQGKLAAINVGSGKKRPLYRIPQEALTNFKNPKVQPSPLQKRIKPKHHSTVPDFFPGLR